METRVRQPSVGEPSHTTGMVLTAFVIVGPDAFSFAGVKTNAFVPFVRLSSTAASDFCRSRLASSMENLMPKSAARAASPLVSF